MCSTFPHGLSADEIAFIESQVAAMPPALSSAHPMSRRRVLTGTAVGLLVVGTGALGGAWGVSPTRAAPTEPGIHTLLGRGLPAVAPGYALLLQRVNHQPGDAVPTHIHPGAEILYVETGTYIYTYLHRLSGGRLRHSWHRRHPHRRLRHRYAPGGGAGAGGDRDPAACGRLPVPGPGGSPLASGHGRRSG
jgi:hypothetical protein